LSAMQRAGSRLPVWRCGNRSRVSILNSATQRRIVFEKFHVMQHAKDAVDEARRAELFRKGVSGRGLCYTCRRKHSGWPF
jgi:hypothetical protein